MAKRNPTRKKTAAAVVEAQPGTRLTEVLAAVGAVLNLDPRVLTVEVQLADMKVAVDLADRDREPEPEPEPPPNDAEPDSEDT